MPVTLGYDPVRNNLCPLRNLILKAKPVNMDKVSFFPNCHIEINGAYVQDLYKLISMHEVCAGSLPKVLVIFTFQVKSAALCLP